MALTTSKLLKLTIHHLKPNQSFAKTLTTKPLHLHGNLFTDNKMSAWQVHSYGGVEELQLSSSIRIPILTGPNDVLVKVQAASVNPIDIAMMGGYGSSVFNGMRQAEQLCQCRSEKMELPLTLGRDFAGEVVECGHGVQDLKPGDQVWGVTSPHQQGCHAKYVVAPSATVCERPQHLSAAEASSLPYAALTAWSALWYSAGLFLWPARGKRVLVLGGSGGVGTAAVQMLKAWGAQVVVTCRTDALPLLESLGADAVIDYTSPDADKMVKEEGLYDIIFNASGVLGEPHLSNLKEWHLARYVTISPPFLRNTDQYGVMAGGIKSIFDLLAPNLKGIASKGATVRWGFFAPSKSGLANITMLTNTGKLAPVIDSTYSFVELPEAYKKQMAGHMRGKAVVKMDE